MTKSLCVKGKDGHGETPLSANSNGRGELLLKMYKKALLYVQQGLAKGLDASAMEKR